MTDELRFEKLHGAGNDFIFLEDLDDMLELSTDDVVRLCDRHFGIGADGIIVVKPPKDSDNAGFMHYINSDGTLAEMCGNGVRCFAKYVVDHKIVAPGTRLVKVETRAGVKEITYNVDNDGMLVNATVNMGAPSFGPDEIPTTLTANAATAFGEPFVKDEPIASPYGTFRFTCISMGNPHAVTFVDDVDSIDVAKIGEFYERCDEFPEKANIEFASVCSDEIRMRVYERGCSETLACGTGACATAVAAFLTGRAGTDNDVHLQGGVLHISYEPGAHVHMTGPAALSYRGSVAL